MKKEATKWPAPNKESVEIAYYEARSSITGPCGHRHSTVELAEKCAKSFAAAHRRKHPANKHTYWHVASVDKSGIRRRISDDV